MARIEDYSNLNRKERELLSKGYNFKIPFITAFSVKTKEICSKVKTFEDKNPISALVSLYKAFDLNSLAHQSAYMSMGDFQFILKKKPPNTLFVTMSYDPEVLLKDLKVISLISSSRSPSLEIIHNHSNAATRIKLDTATNLNVRMSLGKPELGTGLKVNLNLQDKSLSKYEVAFWWFKNQREIVAKQIFTGKYRFAVFDQMFISYYQSLNLNTQIAGSARFNPYESDFFLELGGKHQLNEEEYIKAKINTKGEVGLAYFTNFYSLLYFNTSAQIDLEKLSSDYMNSLKLGVRLDFKIEGDM